MTERTAAHLSNAIDSGYLDIERLHGRSGARLAAESHTAAIDWIEKDHQRRQDRLRLSSGGRISLRCLSGRRAAHQRRMDGRFAGRPQRSRTYHETSRPPARTVPSAIPASGRFPPAQIPGRPCQSAPDRRMPGIQRRACHQGGKRQTGPGGNEVRMRRHGGCRRRRHQYAINNMVTIHTKQAPISPMSSSGADSR